MGVYLVWPAFYTDVTDSYRLGRGGRVRTDLGGLYFNALVAVGTVGVWWLTGYDALLLVVAAQILQMVRQLLPLVRFDGYHVLADVTGVPDLFQGIKPTLLGILPWNWRKPESRVLKPWARAVVTVWVLTVVPLLLFCLALMVLALPRVLGSAWASVQEQQAMLSGSWADGAMLDASARVLSIVAIALPVLGIVYLLGRLVRQVTGSVWRRTEGRPVRRGVAIGTAAALVAGLAWVWWPDGDTYRPIQPYERGTITDAVSSVSFARPAPAGLEEGRPGQLLAVWPAGTGADLPTRDAPQLAMVLVPRTTSDGGRAAGTDGTGASSSGTGEEAPSWVFPFNRPLPPEEGDNQALAANTTDGSVVYDVAFALVWVEKSDRVLNVNEAYAFASCTDCAAVAVAVGFQVVLVVGQADIVVPQNLSAAVNYNCVRCLTYALASQLVVTLDGPLSSAGMEELSEVWADLAEFGENIEDLPLSELRERLNVYQAQILSIIEDAQSESESGSEPATAEPSADPDPGTTDPSPAPTDGSDPDGSATTGPGQTEPSSSGAEEPDPTPTSDPTPTAEESDTTTNNEPSAPTSSPTSPEPSESGATGSP